MTVDDDFSIERLLREFLGKTVPPQEFCSTFENWWNFVARKEAFPQNARTALKKLFEVASFYALHDDDRKYYPGYTSVAELAEAAKSALEAIVVEREPDEK